jgi:hypothetical protein
MNLENLHENDNFKVGAEFGFSKGYLEGFQEAELEIDLILSGKDSAKTGYPWTVLRRIVEDLEEKSKT